MDWAAPFLGLALILAAIAYGIMRAWRLFRRGHRDHVWIFREANSAALFLGVVLGTHALVRLIVMGATSETLAWILIALVLLPAPHFYYAIGRLSGIWQRSKEQAQRPLMD